MKVSAERLRYAAGPLRQNPHVDRNRAATERPAPRILAILGSGSSLAMLEDFADDIKFRGKVIFEFYPSAFYAGDWARGARLVEEHIRAHRSQGALDPLETRLRLGLQGTLVMLGREVSLARLLGDLVLHRRLPARDIVDVEPSRFQAADFRRRAGSPETWTFDPDAIVPPAERTDRIARANRSVRRLRARGGDVLFFRMASSGRVRELKARHLPRETFWGEFTTRSEAETLHFEDVPALAGYICPDGSHLDAGQARRFSEALAQELARRGWLGEVGLRDNQGRPS